MMKPIFINLTHPDETKNAFMTATEQGDANKVRELLEDKNMPPNFTATREGFGRSALSLAATYGQTFVLAELLRVSLYIYIQYIVELFYYTFHNYANFITTPSTDVFLLYL